MSRRLVIAVALLAALAAGCDWPMFGYSPAHTRVTPDTSISSADLPTRMQPAWTASVPVGDVFYSSPTVVNGVLYIGGGGDDHTLYAFDAAGSTNCSGSPVSCAPLWTATTGRAIQSSPAVVNGVVYVGSNDGKLYAFDARGVTGCSGAPRTCQPLWTAATAAQIVASPTVVDGVVYISSFDHRLYAFDAAGVTNCSGTPTTCAPLWTTVQTGGGQSSPTVVNGVVYVGDESRNIAAYDAAGSTNCSGTPKVCSPLWTATAPGAVEGTIAVANGRAYVPGGALQVYDAAGSAGCSGTPTTCTPLWTYATDGSVIASPAVANGVVYVPTTDSMFDAFDAKGVTNCSGTPVSCTPLWRAVIGSQAFGQSSSPTVANGVVYVGTEDAGLDAFDAAGVTNCSGTPATCTPLWSGQTAGAVRSSPTVANGFVYVLSNELQAFVDDTQAPSTTVLAPKSGSALSGPVTLLESATDNVRVSSVEFHIVGGNFDDERIGVATPNGHGGSFGWDTTSVPNGQYTLTSVAIDEVGNVGRSPGVTITVQN